jgi:hypothetical protein
MSRAVGGPPAATTINASPARRTARGDRASDGTGHPAVLAGEQFGEFGRVGDSTAPSFSTRWQPAGLCSGGCWRPGVEEHRQGDQDDAQRGGGEPAEHGSHDWESDEHCHMAKDVEGGERHR